MIIDTSAIIAILRDEQEAMVCARAIADATIRRGSAVNFVESAVAIDASRDPIQQLIPQAVTGSRKYGRKIRTAIEKADP